ncbi:hypothetical protein HK098_003656 [Nowakowskiella sp. JEL0407]|nr:hypothetical protein HK098_003656 [Nowakowskiella sp. JEL0407]
MPRILVTIVSALLLASVVYAPPPYWVGLGEPCGSSIYSICFDPKLSLTCKPLNSTIYLGVCEISPPSSPIPKVTVPIGGTCGSQYTVCETGAFCASISSGVQKCAKTQCIPGYGECPDSYQCYSRNTTYASCVPKHLNTWTPCDGPKFDIELKGYCGIDQTCGFAYGDQVAVCIIAGKDITVPNGGQCRGPNYKGSSVCDTGLDCVYQNDTTAICVPVTVKTATTTQVAITSLSTTVGLGGQCGGNGYLGPTICESGLRCVYKDSIVSICETSPTTTTRASRTAAHSPTSTNEIVKIGYQCGGLGYNGPSICESGAECVDMDDTFAICLPIQISPSISTTIPIASATTSSTSTATTVPIGFQCGGIGYTGITVCEPGTECIPQDETFSICLPVQQTSPRVTTTTTIPKSSITTSTSTSTATVVSIGLQSKPCSSKWGQCGGIGWTGATCCESGSTCQRMNDHYSQCIETPQTNPSCAAKWGQCGGNGWTGAKCCVTGTTCQSLNPYYSQCL